MIGAETFQEELRQLVEVAGGGMYGSTALKKRVSKLLQEYKGKIKSTYEIRQEWSKIRGSLAEEVVRMRAAE